MSARLFTKLAGFAFVAGLTCSALASPVGFKDSIMTMGELSNDWREISAMYSYTSRDAIAAGYTDVRRGAERWQMTDVHANRLVSRWNLPDAQLNLYALLGISAATSTQFSSTQALWQPGLQLDYETRRVYFATSWHGYYSKDVSANRGNISSGFSLYTTEYDEIQPWFIIEAAKTFGTFKQEAKADITPYFRIIHKRLFAEIGATLDRPNAERWKFNFRYTF